VDDRGADEVTEQRMRAGGTGAEFGVELPGYEEGMIRELHDLGQPSLL
jgi:hypothetical protein